MPEQEDGKRRQERGACQQDARADGRDAGYQAQNGGGQHPSARERRFRIFELHDAILQRRRAARCSEQHIQNDAAVRRLVIMNSPRLRMLPGERDPGNLTQGPSDSFGGPQTAVASLQGPSTMDTVTTAERKKEGGGAASQRHISSR